MKRALKRVAMKMAKSKKLVIGTGVVGASTASFAADATPLDTALTGVSTAATTGLASVQTHSATVIAAVFGVALLFVGAKYLFGAIKQR